MGLKIAIRCRWGGNVINPIRFELVETLPLLLCAGLEVGRPDCWSILGGVEEDAVSWRFDFVKKKLVIFLAFIIKTSIYR